MVTASFSCHKCSKVFTLMAWSQHHLAAMSVPKCLLETVLCDGMLNSITLCWVAAELANGTETQQFASIIPTNQWRIQEC